MAETKDQTKKNIPKPTFLGKNIRFLRRLRGLSQTDLAEAIEVKRSRIASYEAGVVEPNVAVFLLLCDFFEQEPSTMLDTILLENPSAALPDLPDGMPIPDLAQSKEFDELVSRTNELTKIWEGYSTMLALSPAKDQLTSADRELQGSLDDVLALLKILVEHNWSLIEGTYPDTP